MGSPGKFPRTFRVVPFPRLLSVPTPEVPFGSHKWKENIPATQKQNASAWTSLLPDGYSQILSSYVFGPSGFLTMAPPSTLAQSKERKGYNFAIWQPCCLSMLVIRIASGIAGKERIQAHHDLYSVRCLSDVPFGCFPSDPRGYFSRS